MTHDSYDRASADSVIGTADEFDFEDVDWCSLPVPRTPLADASQPPQICTDGSLVIDAAGQVVKATPEQQKIALRARLARDEGRDDCSERVRSGRIS
jgi:hypothetical protein